jgi:RNA polymerase sigma-70 factor (ECF subfamily)
VADQELDPELRAKGGASDLVQETFLEAHRDFPRFHGSTQAELRAWLRRLLLNNLANFARRYRATARRGIHREVPLRVGHGIADPAADTPSPSGEALAHEQAEAVQRAMARLPEDYANVIRLRHQEQCSFEEIGRHMNRTANAARMLWLRAIERLRQELGD